MSNRYAYEVRARNGCVLSSHRGMFRAACAAALWNIFYADPRIHWIGGSA